jgi:hypothetical protein
VLSLFLEGYETVVMVAEGRAGLVPVHQVLVRRGATTGLPPLDAVAAQRRGATTGPRGQLGAARVR